MPPKHARSTQIGILEKGKSQKRKFAKAPEEEHLKDNRNTFEHTFEDPPNAKHRKVKDKKDEEKKILSTKKTQKKYNDEKLEKKEQQVRIESSDNSEKTESRNTKGQKNKKNETNPEVLKKIKKSTKNNDEELPETKNYLELQEELTKANENVSTKGRKKKSTENKTFVSPTEESDKKETNFSNKIESDLNEVIFDCDKTNKNGDKFNLKICSWNVSGIRAAIKKGAMKYLVKENADIILLQEIKCVNNVLPKEIKLTGYHHYYYDSEKSGYCGVALYTKEKPIFIKDGLKNSDCEKEGRIITAEYDKFYVVNVYVPNSGSKLITLPKRLKWNEAFKHYVVELDKKKPVIICGDLNVAHQEIDLKNPKTNTKNAGFTKEERDGMTGLLQCGFIDTFRKLYPEKIAYTFWSYMNHARVKNIGWRLDYFLVSERISNQICDNVIRSQVYGSDHCPIVLYANF